MAGPAGFPPGTPELIATTAQGKDPLDAFLDPAVDEELNTGFSLGGIKQTALCRRFLGRPTSESGSYLVYTHASLITPDGCLDYLCSKLQR